MTARPLYALVAALAAVPATAQTLPQPPQPQQIAGTRLDIVATGEANRVPDVALVTAGVVTQARNAAEAVAANAAKMAAVVAAVRRAGIADRDIATSSLSLQPQYRYAEGQPPALTGYQVTNQLSLKLREVTRAGAVLDMLVGQGLNQIRGPNLTVDKPEEAQDEARAKAIATARARANLYAKAAGLRVGRILSISESGDYAPRPPMPVMMMRAAAAPKAETGIEAGEQTLSVSVSVSFELL